MVLHYQGQEGNGIDNTDNRGSAAKRRLAEMEASSDNENQCCICFEMYNPL